MKTLSLILEKNIIKIYLRYILITISIFSLLPLVSEESSLKTILFFFIVILISIFSLYHLSEDPIFHEEEESNL